jgi:hypothetical protein
MTAVVSAHRCGAVPDSHRVPSYDTQASARVNRPQSQYKHDPRHPGAAGDRLAACLYEVPYVDCIDTQSHTVGHMHTNDPVHTWPLTS